MVAAVTRVPTGHPVTFLRDISVGDRRLLHLALAGIAASLLGFFIATISILLGLLDSERPRLKKAFVGANKEHLQAFFTAGILAAAVNLAGFILLGFLDDVERMPRILEDVALVLVFVLGLATARIVWVLSKVVTIASKD
ncbi:MAG: hypothetical protein KY456_10525 [Chloroflexi bacterium]|nr:hypothetical protein [Chloroflexota bacterium]